MARFAPVLVFLLVFAFLFWLVGQRLVLLDNDDGIYLDAARRVALGEAPYRDFFYLSGPGTPWAMGLIMKLCGANIVASRLVLLFDLALMAAIIFWMTRRLTASSPASHLAAAIAVLLFTGFLIAQPISLLPNHRWDSGAAALAAVALTWLCRERARWWYAVLAGFAVAASVWATPAMALLAVTLSLWFLCDRRLRPSALPFLATGLAGLLGGLLWLQSHDALQPMIDQLFWIGSHYSGANRMAYGQIVGGYGAFFQGSSDGLQLGVGLAILFLFAIPAWLPIAATLGWLMRLRASWSSIGELRFQIPFLMVCGAVIIACQAPRMDLPHLRFASAVYYVLGVSLAALALRGWQRFVAALCFLLAAGVFTGYACMLRINERTLHTRVGSVRISKGEAAILEKFESLIRPGDSLFVFPYMPVYYFALDGRNPTRYSFLQPGMSSVQDEANVLADLRLRPPQWVIYLDVPPASYLRIWPSSDPARLRMDSIEQFIAGGYADVAKAGPYTLKRRR